MITEGKIKIAMQSKVNHLVKYEMSMSNVSADKAYIKVMQTKLFNLLNKEETKLYLEPLEFILEAYMLETKYSEKAMLNFIQYV